jgi:hypothetical protein
MIADDVCATAVSPMERKYEKTVHGWRGHNFIQFITGYRENLTSKGIYFFRRSTRLLKFRNLQVLFGGYQSSVRSPVSFSDVVM